MKALLGMDCTKFSLLNTFKKSYKNIIKPFAAKSFNN